MRGYLDFSPSLPALICTELTRITENLFHLLSQKEHSKKLLCTLAELEMK